MVLTHQQQQQQHLIHLDCVGIVFQKYRVRFQKPQEWENRVIPRTLTLLDHRRSFGHPVHSTVHRTHLVSP